MISTIKGYLSPSKGDDEEKVGSNGSHENGGESCAASVPSETTSLLGHAADETPEQDFLPSKQLFLSLPEASSSPPPPPPPKYPFLGCIPVPSSADADDPVHPLPDRPPSVKEFYFHKSNNPTVQRYYRFHATPITPIVALHKRPGASTTGVSSPTVTAAGGGVTGLLRRSAVVPSHGVDETDGWILVSVGGRSGWARKKTPGQHFSGFTLAETFAATEGWMGNHAFFFKGRCMLGSDAPSLVFTNLLIAVGYVWHFVVVLPTLHSMEVRGDLSIPWPFYDATEQQQGIHATPVTATLFWWSVFLGTLSVITLWISALMDPGIIPPVSSPVKAPVPENVPLGGPLGYRYCSTCNIFRPPRSKHCNSCNVCVSKFDQYVPTSCSVLTTLLVVIV
jgi:hypothetical protein